MQQRSCCIEQATHGSVVVIHLCLFFFFLTVEEVNKKRLLELRAEIQESSSRLQQLLFEKEQKEKEYAAGVEKYNQQKECKS